MCSTEFPLNVWEFSPKMSLVGCDLELEFRVLKQGWLALLQNRGFAPPARQGHGLAVLSSFGVFL